MIDLSIIVPAYNEVNRIAATLQSMRDYLQNGKWTWEIILCADGDDGTRQAALAWAGGDDRLKIIGSPIRLGKGRGVRKGVELAAGQTIGFIDADYKTPIEELAKLLPGSPTDYDIAIGSRKVGEARDPGAAAAVSACRLGRFPRRHGNAAGLVGHPPTRNAASSSSSRDAAKTALLAPAHRRLHVRRGDSPSGPDAGNDRIKEVGVCWRDDGDSRYAPFSGTIKNARELLRIRVMRYPRLSPPK
jgi:dolichyl-phosphate beta-glucosyltransferase